MAAAEPITINTASHGNRNASAVTAKMEMGRVDANHSPKTPAVTNAAVMARTNQPSLGLSRSVLRPAASGFTAFASAI